MKKKLLVKGIKINVCILSGVKKKPATGHDFLILHGWGGSCHSWVAVGVMLQKLGWRVIIPEWPGCGESGALDRVWRTDDYGDAVLEIIEQLKLQKITVLAHSHGGRVLLKMLARGAGDFQKVLVFGAAGIPHKLNFRQKMARFLAWLGKPFQTVPFFGKILDKARTLVYRAIGGHDYLMLRDNFLKKTMAQVLKTDLTPLLPRISVPVVLLWGDRDTYTPLADGQKMHELLPKSELVVIPGARHGHHLHNPSEFFQVLKAHL